MPSRVLRYLRSCASSPGRASDNNFPRISTRLLSTTTNMSAAFLRLSRARAPYIRSFRAFSTSIPRLQSPTPSIPYTETCPSPTCACAAAPPDLDIDRKTPLLNTMAPYTEQVLLATGKEDWTSNLEDDSGLTADFVKGLKSIIGKGGEAFDVCKPPAIRRSYNARRGWDHTLTTSAIHQRPHHRQLAPSD
jgi:hypothetical protein